MTDASPSLPLSTVSYIVLGLLARCGSATSYDLKSWADGSVGYFWTFPRSQLYAEPQRLVGLGLLSEQQETAGRRRRTFGLTAAGLAALHAWLATPAGQPELRDPGLLKLFFMEETPQALAPLAAEQLRLHRARLADYAQLAGAASPLAPSVTLRMGQLYEQANITFWEELLDRS